MRHRLRVLSVIALAEYKLKYSGSVLGYVWSFVKPLALFTMMYLVFGRIFKLETLSPYYGLSLLMGILLYSFFNDATSLGLFSLVANSSLLRKMSFPRSIIPTAATLTAALTFTVNIAVIALFVGWKRLVPQLDWFLLIPLLLELYIFTLGVALILATLFVRLRDMGQIWELLLQLFFYASPIIYPIGYLPPWARNIAFLNPFTQILQDVRVLVIYPEAPKTATAVTAFGPLGRLVPISIAIATFLIGAYVLRRQEPTFAEHI